MRMALLVCDRCGAEEKVPAGQSAVGWRMILSNTEAGAGTIDKDLCPTCDQIVMAAFDDVSQALS